MLKIAVRDIPFKGLDIDKQVSCEEIGLADEVDIQSLMHIKAHLAKADNFIIADTELTADFSFQCSRCLEPIISKQTYQYKFDFEILEDLEEIDLGEEIRQEIIMANPARILCQKDCKGVCKNCGANLNNEPCQCKEK
ncbi:MAG: DUF177 domain-containing protein [Candidatus Omnitrophica bacterium]|nr:DUF177 domain-containing protein [Candidatus Omnitrophota bacterium]